MTGKTIDTALGKFSKEKFRALVNVRETALHGLREALKEAGYTEVTTSTLVNIAGSCENPHASFPVDYYGREAHLSQSAQIQLEALVMRLKHGFFTVNNSFREENYDDPEAKGRRLSEFTLIESEKPYESLSYEEALNELIEDQATVIRCTLVKVLSECSEYLTILGGDLSYLERTLDTRFQQITYDDALNLLSNRKRKYEFGADLGITEEREILRHFDNVPTFITHYPSFIKFFNMKRMPDGKRVYSVDLLMPRLGETIGGAVREEDGDVIKEQLETSKVGAFMQEQGIPFPGPFAEYFRTLKEEPPTLRAGYGIGFERLIGFLIGSTDILETVAYRTLQP